MGPGMAATAARALEQYQTVSPLLERTLRSVQAGLRVTEGIRELWRRYSPDNWHELQVGEPDIVDFLEESGIPIVWVPRAATIEALIAGESSARYEILASSSDWVLDDLEAVLARARGADVRGHADACEFAGDAIASARGGHWAAGQALAACGLGQVIHGMLDFPVLGGLGRARKQFRERDIEETTMMVLKAALLEVCTANALTDIPYADPQAFNRHGTQHGDRRFFSRASALGGMLLLVGWIREFTWLDEHGLLTEDDNAE